MLPFALLVRGGGRHRAAGGDRLLVARRGHGRGRWPQPATCAFGTGILHLTRTLECVQDQGAWQSLPGLLLLAHRTCHHQSRDGSPIDAVLVAALLWLLRRVWQGRMDWIDGAAWATFAVLLTAWSLLPWYVCLDAAAGRAEHEQAALDDVAMVATLMGGAMMIASCFPNWTWLDAASPS